MRSSHSPSPALAAALTWLAALTLTAGCADDGNPVLPPYTTPSGPGGPLTSGTTDARTSGRDAEQVVVSRDDASATGGADANPVVLGARCDLTQQDCKKGEACYPIDGEGRCAPEGGVGLLGSCTVGEFPPTCLRGLTCVAQFASMSGWCVILCDKDDPAATCTFGYSCMALPSFPTTSRVGYCEPA